MNYLAEVISKNQLTHKMWDLRIRLVEPFEMVFKAGQCVAFHVNPKNKRLYSIASVPAEKNELYFLIDISPQGLGSKMIVAMKPGDRFELSGPFGIFTVPETDKDLLFIGTGSGLAPYVSIVPDLKTNNFKNSIELWFGVRSESDLFCTDHLQMYATENPNFKYFVSLSQPSQEWKGYVGRITAHLASKSSEYFTNKIVYICGSTQMIKDVRAILLEKGINARDIKVEIFG